MMPTVGARGLQGAGVGEVFGFNERRERERVTRETRMTQQESMEALGAEFEEVKESESVAEIREEMERREARADHARRLASAGPRIPKTATRPLGTSKYTSIPLDELKEQELLAAEHDLWRNSRSLPDTSFRRIWGLKPFSAGGNPCACTNDPVAPTSEDDSDSVFSDDTARKIESDIPAPLRSYIANPAKLRDAQIELNTVRSRARSTARETEAHELQRLELRERLNQRLREFKKVGRENQKLERERVVRSRAPAPVATAALERAADKRRAQLERARARQTADDETDSDSTPRPRSAAPNLDLLSRNASGWSSKAPTKPVDAASRDAKPVASLRAPSRHPPVPSRKVAKRAPAASRVATPAARTAAAPVPRPAGPPSVAASTSTRASASRTSVSRASASRASTSAPRPSQPQRPNTISHRVASSARNTTVTTSRAASSSSSVASSSVRPTRTSAPTPARASARRAPLSGAAAKTATRRTQRRPSSSSSSLRSGSVGGSTRRSAALATSGRLDSSMRRTATFDVAEDYEDEPEDPLVHQILNRTVDSEGLAAELSETVRRYHPPPAREPTMTELLTMTNFDDLPQKQVGESKSAEPPRGDSPRGTAPDAASYGVGGRRDAPSSSAVSQQQQRRTSHAPVLKTGHSGGQVSSCCQPKPSRTIRCTCGDACQCNPCECGEAKASSTRSHARACDSKPRDVSTRTPCFPAGNPTPVAGSYDPGHHDSMWTLLNWNGANKHATTSTEAKPFIDDMCRCDSGPTRLPIEASCCNGDFHDCPRCAPHPSRSHLPIAGARTPRSEPVSHLLTMMG